MSFNLPEEPQRSSEERAAQDQAVPEQGSAEEEDDDLRTLSRTNHRVRSMSEVYGLSAEAEPKNSAREAQVVAEVLTWCFSTAAVLPLEEPSTPQEALWDFAKSWSC